MCFFGFLIEKIIMLMTLFFYQLYQNELFLLLFLAI